MAATFQSHASPNVEHHIHLSAEHCPWCEQPIPHDKFDEIKNRIETRQRIQFDEQAKQLKAQFAVEKAKDNAKAQAELDQHRKDTASKFETLQQQSLAGVALAREEARKAAEGAMQSQLAAAAHEVRTLTETHESVLNQRLHEQRDALEKSASANLNVERSKSFEEKQKLETALQDVQRRLQNKTAQELGEGAEIDLHEALKEEFPNDDITRVSKGASGADLIHKVLHNGKPCGLIVYDSKNRNAWRNDFVTKLRDDQLIAKADHAILSSHVFPAGAHQLHLQDGVIVTNPARVVALAQLLRNHIVQMHTLRISQQERASKTEDLYQFITSDRCKMLLDQIESHTSDMLELDVKEQTAHKTTWARRGQLIRDVQKRRDALSFEIERIIGTAEGPPKP